MTKEEGVLMRAILHKWAAWRTRKETAYLSPPNLIWRLMHGDIGGGGGFGSVEPRGLPKSHSNPAMQLIDDKINALPESRRATIYCEFLNSGSQKDKADVFEVSVKGYRKNLYSALKQLFNNKDVKNIVKPL